jgi:hypothetical protein
MAASERNKRGRREKQEVDNSSNSTMVNQTPYKSKLRRSRNCEKLSKTNRMEGKSEKEIHETDMEKEAKTRHQISLEQMQREELFSSFLHRRPSCSLTQNSRESFQQLLLKPNNP